MLLSSQFDAQLLSSSSSSCRLPLEELFMFEQVKKNYKISNLDNNIDFEVLFCAKQRYFYGMEGR